MKTNKIHGSIHIWVTAHLGEILRCFAWHLPQVFACYLTLINYISLSFTGSTLWQNIPSFYKKWMGGGKRWPSCGGTLAFAIYYIGSNFPVIPRQNCLPWMALRLKGRERNSTMTSLFSWYRQRKKWQGLESMVCRLYGWTLIRPGSPPWRKQLGNWLPVPPVDLIGPMPWCSYMRVPSMCQSLRRATWASYPNEGWRWLPACKSAN